MDWYPSMLAEQELAELELWRNWLLPGIIFGTWLESFPWAGLDWMDTELAAAVAQELIITESLRVAARRIQGAAALAEIPGLPASALWSGGNRSSYALGVETRWRCCECD